MATFAVGTLVRVENGENDNGYIYDKDGRVVKFENGIYTLKNKYDENTFTAPEARVKRHPTAKWDPHKTKVHVVLEVMLKRGGMTKQDIQEFAVTMNGHDWNEMTEVDMDNDFGRDGGNGGGSAKPTRRYGSYWGEYIGTWIDTHCDEHANPDNKRRSLWRVKPKIAKLLAAPVDPDKKKCDCFTCHTRKGLKAKHAQEMAALVKKHGPFCGKCGTHHRVAVGHYCQKCYTYHLGTGKPCAKHG
jgi:hypothetical protein